tara:strand:+ start:869 stop:1171 length:303 start_codon:yes stop_codon:yes gene_type:complete
VNSIGTNPTPTLKCIDFHRLGILGGCGYRPDSKKEKTKNKPSSIYHEVLSFPQTAISQKSYDYAVKYIDISTDSQYFKSTRQGSSFNSILPSGNPISQLL